MSCVMVVMLWSMVDERQSCKSNAPLHITLDTNSKEKKKDP